jgi:hypothetical protein
MLAGARGKSIVGITHFLVVERSYFIEKFSSAEISFAASCLSHSFDGREILDNSPALASTFGFFVIHRGAKRLRR